MRVMSDSFCLFFFSIFSGFLRLCGPVVDVQQGSWKAAATAGKKRTTKRYPRKSGIQTRRASRAKAESPTPQSVVVVGAADWAESAWAPLAGETLAAGIRNAWTIFSTRSVHPAVRLHQLCSQRRRRRPPLTSGWTKRATPSGRETTLGLRRRRAAFIPARMRIPVRTAIPPPVYFALFLCLWCCSFLLRDCHSDDEPERKLHVEIKPITNGANQPGASSIDELKATIGNLNINSSMFNTAGRRDMAEKSILRDLSHVCCFHFRAARILPSTLTPLRSSA